MNSYFLRDNQYGKAENRVVRISRKSTEHEIRDFNVSTCLRGAFSEAYTIGDQSQVLPTDTQKNMTFVIAKTEGITSLANYGIALAQHFVHNVPSVKAARIEIDEYRWRRVPTAEGPHPHCWTRIGNGVRTAAITYNGSHTYFIDGIKDLVILKSTGSQFTGFYQDKYTTLAETTDRMMGTALVIRWLYHIIPEQSDALYEKITGIISSVFATEYSLALQQTLYAIAGAIIETVPEIAEVRLSAPNNHYFLYDLERFDIENDNEIYIASDRPYGLIQATVSREGFTSPSTAWENYQHWLS